MYLSTRYHYLRRKCFGSNSKAHDIDSGRRIRYIALYRIAAHIHYPVMKLCNAATELIKQGYRYLPALGQIER